MTDLAPDPLSFAGAPIRTPRVFEEICGRIRAEMKTGRLKPGDKLPAERDLAIQFGTSRAAVREALHNLELTGVVELRKGVKGGAFVQQGDPAMVTRSISDMVDLGRIPLEDLTESRLLLLDSVIRLACERATEEDFRKLELSIDRTEELTRRKRHDERRHQLLQFYRLLAQATRNEVMVILVDAVTDIVLKILSRGDIPAREHTVATHRAIVANLRRRNAAKASKLMAAHLQALHLHLFAEKPDVKTDA